MEASGAEQFEKINASQSNERELLDGNRRLEHQLVMVVVEKEQHSA